MDYIIIGLIIIFFIIFLIKYYKNKKDNKNNKDNKDNEMIYQFMKRPAESGDVEKPAIISEEEKPYIDMLKEFDRGGLPIVLKDFVTWTNSESGTIRVYKDMYLQNYIVMYFKKDKETGAYKIYLDKEYTRLVVLCDFLTGGILEGFVSRNFYV